MAILSRAVAHDELGCDGIGARCSEAQPDGGSDDSDHQADAKAQRQQARADKRQDQVAAGLEVLDTWLADLARDGADARQSPAGCHGDGLRHCRRRKQPPERS